LSLRVELIGIAAPAHSLRADPARLRLVEFEGAGDEGLLAFWLRPRAREAAEGDAPGGKLGLGRDAQRGRI
jgi:hypothetical protein